MSILADELIEAIVAWIARMLAGALNLLWELLSATVFMSPDVTGLPQVRMFAGTSLAVVNTSYVLAILTAAIVVMTRETVHIRYTIGDLAPRLAVGLIAANFALPLCSAIISVANAVTAALTAQQVTSANPLNTLRGITAGLLSGETQTVGASAVLLIIIGVLVAVQVATMAMQWIVRLGLLVVLAGIAPVALALHGLPFTEGAAKLWWRALLGTVGTTTAQAVVLHIGLSVFFDPQAQLPAPGLRQPANEVFNLLIVACLLWTVLKIPSLMSRYVMHSSVSWRRMAPVMLLQQTMRWTRIPSRMRLPAGNRQMLASRAWR
ncbi:hypothetical protein [Catelliglobosispora koreensis]|uniref:hypothetical protein n=1 Tax=Catelliglobosispora koreensis TaxID=129052 RepID=UPI00036EBEFD|nr:hypothetical protein [Catelliglobosispora koreensis]